jgi:hypothetical protein
VTTIFEKVTAALGTISPPVTFAFEQLLIQDGSDFPDTFLVYSLISDAPTQHADNAETQRSYRIQISTYSRSGLVSVPDVDTAMITAGFIKGPRRLLPYDEMTRHFSMAVDYFYNLEV